MIARRSISFIVALALFLVAGALAVAGPGEGTFVDLINADRQANGLNQLEPMSLLTTYARGHSEEMAAAGQIYHSTSDELRGITTGWLRIGENVGVGGSVQSLHTAFMNSAAHRANVLGDYTHVGIGTVESGGRIYVTEIFMKFPASSTTTTTTTTTTTPSTTTSTTSTTTSTTTTTTSPSTTVATADTSTSTSPPDTTAAPTTTTTEAPTTTSEAPASTEPSSTTDTTEPVTAPSTTSTTEAPTATSSQPPVTDGNAGFIPSSGPVAPGTADTVRLVAGIVLGAAVVLFLLTARRRREEPTRR